jgi:nucleoside-diphosphate-sugar epimerase
LIHTSGTGILLYDHEQKGLDFGALSTKIFNDWDSVKEVISLPDAAIHRKVDKAVLEAEKLDSNIKTVIVSPPVIYGVGRGPVNQRSIQIPELIKGTLVKGHGIQVLEGNARWSTIHVHDLSDLYLRLVEEAVKGGGNATWGADGYYFAQNDEIRWGDVGHWAADEAYKHGFIKSDEMVSLEPEEANRIDFLGAGALLWGVNSRSRAERAAKLLNWEPMMKSVKEEMENAVLIEAKALGLIA